MTARYCRSAPKELFQSLRRRNGVNSTLSRAWLEAASASQPLAVPLVPTHSSVPLLWRAVELTSTSTKPALYKNCRLILALLWTWLLSEAVDVR